MTALIVLAGVAGVLLGGSLVAVWLGVGRSVLRSRMRRRVVVTLKSGASFEGLLFEADRLAWVLREASALGAADRGENVLLDGEVLILAAEIDYCQKP